MTATVVSLASRRPALQPACGCPRHRLEALADRARERQADTAGALLVTADDLAALVADVTRTVADVLASSPPTDERTQQ